MEKNTHTTEDMDGINNHHEFSQSENLEIKENPTGEIENFTSEEVESEIDLGGEKTDKDAVYAQQLKYKTIEDIEAAEAEANKEYDDSDKGKKNEKFRAIRNWIGKFLRGTHLGATVATTVLTTGTALANDKEEKLVDPEEFKNKMEISVDTEKKITPDDNAYIAKPHEFGGDSGEGDEIKKAIQEKHDAEIAAKHEKAWEQNHSHYVKDGEELKSVIRHSLSELENNFKDARDLRNGIDKLYGEVLSPTEISNLVSYITEGAPIDKNGVID